MITLIFSTVTFFGGVYVGVRYSDKIKSIYKSIAG